MATMKQKQSRSLKEISRKLDKFTDILDRLANRYVILEKKMRAIEEYFNPHN